MKNTKDNPAARKGVIICGAYGFGNSGDEAILEAIIRQLRSIDPDIPICVISRNPAETQKKHGIPAVYTFNFPGFIKHMSRTRLYINGGGSLIQNVTSRRSLWYYLLNITLAKLLGNQVMMYGCGIGPISGRQDERLVKKILNQHVDAITLRDAQSESELKRLGVTKPEIILSADPALILEGDPKPVIDEIFNRNGLNPDGHYIGFTLRKWPGFEEKSAILAKAADYAYEKYNLTPVFIHIDFGKDSQAEKLVTSQMSAPYHSMEKLGTYSAVIGAFSRMKAVVSMRLHGLIFAASQSVPLIGVVYDPKVSSFLQYMGQNLYIELNNLTTGTLESHIDRALTIPPEELSGRHQQLLALQQENCKTAAKLLGVFKKEVR